MTKKGIALSILIFLLVGVLFYVGYRIGDNTALKRIEQEEKHRIANKLIVEMAYEVQNKAFFGIGFIEYTPYNKKYEWALQINIRLYTRETMKVITLSDVEAFLATPVNHDGTPRTWEDDETGTIKDFVQWCLAGKNAGVLAFYKGELRDILADYRVEDPHCPYKNLEDLTPEQIIELDKKYLDPDYDLILE
ncbi:MAG: hypothetical protein FWG40_07835 [Peptococcaceae bacterium]|nr:hypothetical protein [Peptococcaceae bacterium]